MERLKKHAQKRLLFFRCVCVSDFPLIQMRSMSCEYCTVFYTDSVRTLFKYIVYARRIYLYNVFFFLLLLFCHILLINEQSSFCNPFYFHPFLHHLFGPLFFSLKLEALLYIILTVSLGFSSSFVHYQSKDV